MPSIPLDPNRPCECATEIIRRAYPEHTVREHDFWVQGHDDGWTDARHMVLTAEDPTSHARVRDILG